MAHKFSSTSKLAGYISSPDRLQAKLKNSLSLQSEVFEASRKPVEVREVPMTMITIRSNYARNKTVVLGDRSELRLMFGSNGLATMPEHLLPVLKAEMRSRPGRYFIIEDKAEIPVVSATPALERTIEEVQELMDKLVDDSESDEEELELVEPETVTETEMENE